MPLRTERCTACDGSTPKLSPAEASALLVEISGWGIHHDRLHRRFVFPDFAAAMRFVNAMAAVAEAAGHHPDFTVHYREVDVSIWTHAVGGLTRNDFILAARIEDL